jgi:hypothetical protein
MKKQKLPKGKLNIRHRQMRGVWQVFAGRTYLDGCAGENEDIAMEELCFIYDVPDDIEIVVHGYSEPTTILTKNKEFQSTIKYVNE